MGTRSQSVSRTFERFSDENTVLIANFPVVEWVVVRYLSNCLVFWGGRRYEGFRPHGFKITFKVGHCK